MKIFWRFSCFAIINVNFIAIETLCAVALFELEWSYCTDVWIKNIIDITDRKKTDFMQSFQQKKIVIYIPKLLQFRSNNVPSFISLRWHLNISLMLFTKLEFFLFVFQHTVQKFEQWTKYGNIYADFFFFLRKIKSFSFVLCMSQVERPFCDSQENRKFSSD